MPTNNHQQANHRQQDNHQQGRDRLAEAHAALVRSVEQIVSGDDWRQMLEVARRFHAYSTNNVLLIFAQRPEATRVAGYRTWQRVGRQVRSGEHGIAILAPCLYRVPADATAGSETSADERRALRGFRVVHVFDLSQTDGEPLPDVVPAVLEGDVPGELFERLAEQVRAGGFYLLRGDCRPANGTTHFLARTVVVRPDLPAAQAAKTLAHELAHTLLHDGEEYRQGCRGRVEVEAESVAHLVCQVAGVPTGHYTFPYVARWAEGDVELVRSTAERVVACARGILERVGLAEQVPPDAG